MVHVVSLGMFNLPGMPIRSKDSACSMTVAVVWSLSLHHCCDLHLRVSCQLNAVATACQCVQYLRSQVVICCVTSAAATLSFGDMLPSLLW